MIKYEENVKELARRLCAATLSWELRVSLQHADNNWVKKQESEIGDYWVHLAEEVIAARQMMDSQSQTATNP
jgi:hypothetical protein